MTSTRSRRWTFGLPAAMMCAAGAVLYGFAQAGPSQAAGDGPDGFEPASSALIADPIAFDGPQRVDYGRLDARLQHLMRSKDMVGLGVAVIENGQIRFVKGYGVTAAGTGDPVTTGTVFRWASLSKGVASALVNRLADEGKLSLDAPVTQYQTSLRLPGGNEGRVTVADLLSHRTGIVRNAYDDKLEAGQDPTLIRGMLAGLSPYCAPSTCYTYQNVAFDTSAEIVQRVTGKPYGVLVREKIFGPLGMASASTDRAGLQSAVSWARPHVGQRTIEVNDNYYRVPAAGGVNSSIFDLAKWMRAQMGGAPGVLSAKLLDRVHAPVVATPHGGGRVDYALKNAHYAMGWRDYSYAGHPIVGHRGAVNGYRSLILFDPVKKAGIAMLWNSQSNKPVGIQLELMDMLYQQPFTDWADLGNVPASGAGGTMTASAR
ncbi:serine hydrolase domain-containing protein [Sphingomonas cavernae]|uniref:Class A beta-lactamase-related serine hydrolase n=1 Tax=Sphingomonas cavernae TaxID=2320861 RepID=A0A418W6X5_9SPHN|nr:serine hydrolase domain-containing protein [Sphingomonas cavernae]RJF85614.1 class A beta-lactamase-related serine hydrolase [Sphingomonas cavernae]